MTPEQQKYVIESWNSIETRQDLLAEKFYQRLFETHPGLREIFAGDMKSQEKKLASMMTTVIHNLNQLETFIEPLKKMGARHVDYGVSIEDYDKVAEALIWALEQLLGNLFTDETRQAWQTLYAVIAELMQQGANAVSSFGEPAGTKTSFVTH